MIPIKTGQDHIESLHDGRNVYIYGGPVADVTTHKAFRNTIRTVAALYDFQAQPDVADTLTFASPDTGRRINRCWQLPDSYTQLVERRRALEAWAELHFGFMGCSPDHVASCIGGMFMGVELFEAYDRKRAAALRDYYRFARDNDLFLTYVIINPQADRSKAVHAQADPHLAASVVDEDAEGLTIRGAKMLATSSIMANEVLRHLHPAARCGRREAGDIVRGSHERQGPAGAVPQVVRGERGVRLRQSAVEPVRRKRRRALLR
jgi:4-hydroxyphenylacetate 3-monooxygenase